MEKILFINNMNKIDTKVKFLSINVALITISDTRKSEDDKSGNLLKDRIEKFGHIVSKKIIIWDQYIPSSLAYMHKTRRLLYGKFYQDYCSTLEYLDREIFSKTLLNNSFSSNCLSLL